MGQVKLTRTASASSRQQSRLASCKAASSVSCRTRITGPLIRNCSCVTGKYQQISDQAQRSSSVTFVLRASLTKVKRGESCRNPRKTTVRFAGRPSAAHRRHLDEPRVRRMPILMQGQDQVRATRLFPTYPYSGPSRAPRKEPAGHLPQR